MPRAVFLIPVREQWLLHAPLHREDALINHAAADALRRRGARPRGESLSALHQRLRTEADDIPDAVDGDVCPSFLGIIPTRGCNLNCGYCDFGGPTSSMDHMDPEVAVAAVDWMAERLVRARRRILQVHFFGGEPFVSPEIVDIVVHRARDVAAQRGLVPYLEASSNGVFDERRCQFIGDYFGGLVLSFDGFAEFHNRNRPSFKGRPSFDLVARTARQLSEMPVELCIRICVTKDSVHDLEVITRWMCESFKPAVVNFETVTLGAAAGRAGLQPPDPYDFARHCIGAYRVASTYGVKALYSAAEPGAPRVSCCPVGSDALIVSPDGRVSACYLLPEDWKARGLDLDVGCVRADGSVALDFAGLTRIRELPLHKPRCERCFCRWSCAGGCHVNETYPGCTAEYTGFCIQTRIVTASVLLEGLGCSDLVDGLLADRRAMERLAFHSADVIELDDAENVGP
jgi:uncharacterized protein